MDLQCTQINYGACKTIVEGASQLKSNRANNVEAAVCTLDRLIYLIMFLTECTHTHTHTRARAHTQARLHLRRGSQLLRIFRKYARMFELSCKEKKCKQLQEPLLTYEVGMPESWYVNCLLQPMTSNRFLHNNFTQISHYLAHIRYM